MSLTEKSSDRSQTLSLLHRRQNQQHHTLHRRPSKLYLASSGNLALRSRTRTHSTLTKLAGQCMVCTETRPPHSGRWGTFQRSPTLPPLAQHPQPTIVHQLRHPTTAHPSALPTSRFPSQGLRSLQPRSRCSCHTSVAQMQLPHLCRLDAAATPLSLRCRCHTSVA